MQKKLSSLPVLRLAKVWAPVFVLGSDASTGRLPIRHSPGPVTSSSSALDIIACAPIRASVIRTLSSPSTFTSMATRCVSSSSAAAVMCTSGQPAVRRARTSASSRDTPMLLLLVAARIRRVVPFSAGAMISVESRISSMSTPAR
jgi:hypothetical protein